MLIKKSALPLLHLILIGWMPSPLKKLFYRMRGYSIGRGVGLGLGCVVVGRDVEIGDEAQLGLLTIIRGRSVRIGPRVKIGMMSVLDCPVITVGEGTRINNQVVVGGMMTPQSAFEIGRNCILMEWSFVNTTHPVKIGDDVGIGGHCLFFTHGMWPNTYEGFPAKFAPITIEDQAWLAWRVSVLPGVTVGRRAIVSSDACVVKDIPAGSLAAGVPARILQDSERYVGAHALEDNERRLKTSLEDFIGWLKFHDIEAQWHDGNTVTASAKGKRYALRIQAAPLSGPARQARDPRDLTLVALSPLSPEARETLAREGVAWLDIASKERSAHSNHLADEAEVFLQRDGVRFLKYTRWHPA
jgi:acetyltransferase-like isoleucine patch superfamily enzyme